MLRRDLLKSALCIPAITLSGTLYAAPPGSPRFLLVFLRGGYDSANVLVPHASDDYYTLRPTIAIPRPGSRTDGKDAIRLDDQWALAPALRDSIAPLYHSGEVAFVPFAGCDDLSRSHFETQDAIEFGQPAAASRNAQSGFMARLAMQLQGTRTDMKAIAFTESLPVTYRGNIEIPNISLKGVGKAAFDARQAAILSGMYAGTSLQSAVNEGLELRQQVSREMEQEMKQANRDAITPKGFELEAQRLARLMRDQYRLGFIDIGGWDTHVNQGASDGALANNLTSLGQGLKMLRQELGSEWSNTVVVVISEFGRTFRENGDHGTDHGHGTTYWILGGNIHGGRIVGEQIHVSQATLFQNRDFPVLNDYRALLGNVFGRLWALQATQLEQIFPQSPVMDFGLV